MNKEQTILDLIKEKTEKHFDEIQELAEQMRNIIEELSIQAEMEEEVETLANYSLILFHIEKLKEVLGYYR